jgi:uncharacterized radical SAM superfamily Fe-S cluster-containing enzyme
MGVIRAWYAALKARAGICHIQLSGGEPTLRDDLPEIIEAGIAQGFSYFQLNTNGIRLASDPALAVRLRKAGLSCVFLQFDGIDDAANVTLRGRELLATKGRAIDNCAACGLPVVLVPTVAAGVNDDQLAAIVSYGVARSPHVKGVHFQPLSRFGRCDTDAAGLTIPELLRLLEAQSGGMFQRGHFTGGSAESPYCSFNAAYLIADDGSLAPLRQRKATACCDAMLPEDGLERRALGGCSLEPLPKDGPVRRAQETQARRWGAASGSGECRRPEPGTLDEHLWKMGNRLFSITGMAFMDAHSMDFERLRSCYIFVMSNGGPVPFCAWNLSCASGKSAFRAMGG